MVRRRRRSTSRMNRFKSRDRSEEDEDYSIDHLDPEGTNVHITQHAVYRYLERVEWTTIPEAIESIYQVIARGRRTDRDFKLRKELAPWLHWMRWTNEGRPVVIFYFDHVACLVVRDFVFTDRVRVLTVFSTKEGESGHVQN